ncbi:MAG: RHS repeat-associated core domain-containing protein [Bryobacterales bacterium]|nr:RHS repeat-associated core domain-containing protein [Bryobacterales bacterium]
MGEEVNYTYDSLARLSAAWTTGPEWGQAYSYDGWGNLTGKSVTKGSAPTFSAAYDGATNRQVGVTHDANGNVYRTSYTSYDAENRMTYTDYGPMRTFKYDAMNRRVMVQEYSGPEDELSAEEVTFYGPGGERMGVYRRSIYHEPYQVGTFGGGQAQVWFGGKLIQASGQRVVQDRLGTVTVQGTERMRFWPYGEERGTAAQKRQKWATYWRDESGLDYAMARYQEKGRFLSPDPYTASGGPGVPQSWNRYAYVQNDPVNWHDPGGLMAVAAGESGPGKGFCDLNPLKRRFENIITYLRHRITNAASESINAKIQWVKYTARGFRNKQNSIQAIYFHCGGLDLAPEATK